MLRFSWCDSACSTWPCVALSVVCEEWSRIEGCCCRLNGEVDKNSMFAKSTVDDGKNDKNGLS